MSISKRVSGCVFGDDNYIRFSYVTSMENSVKAIGDSKPLISRHRF